MAETKEQFRKRADLAQQAKINVVKGILSGTYGLPSDIVELFSGAFVPGKAEKALRTTPPGVPPDKPVEVQEGVAPRPEFRPEQIGVPKVKYTSADLARRLGLDPDSGEALLGQLIAPDPFVGIKAAKALKLAEGFGFFGALGSIAQLGKRADKMKSAGKSSEEIAAALNVTEAPTQSGWKRLPEKLPVQAFGGERVMLKRTL